MKEDLAVIYANSFKENWTLSALTDYGDSGSTITYGDMAKRIARLHIFFESQGVRVGDKIALCGRNTSTWVTVFIATITYGAVIVPVLQDFNPQDAQHIINHSEAVLLFVSQSVFEISISRSCRLFVPRCRLTTAGCLPSVPARITCRRRC